MQLDHISILVENIEKGIEKFSQVFGMPSHRENIPGHEVEVAIFQLENSKVELICPYSTNIKLQKRLRDYGEGLHHFAISGESGLVSMDGLNFVPTDNIGAEGRLVKFLNPKQFCGTLIELVGDLEP